MKISRYFLVRHTDSFCAPNFKGHVWSASYVSPGWLDELWSCLEDLLNSFADPADKGALLLGRLLLHINQALGLCALQCYERGICQRLSSNSELSFSSGLHDSWEAAQNIAHYCHYGKCFLFHTPPRGLDRDSPSKMQRD